ncbi:MAG: hypothetical protein LBB88_00505, partial [Planctomycetaceae bacterium]|nr:hypothetical protein [Planctomycetaceae bacterium]
MLQFFDNVLNPLFIRELRQFVRNRFIIILINLYVVSLVIACLFILAPLLTDSWGVYGAYLIVSLGHLVFIASLFAVVLRTAMSMATDKINEDLMFFSSMTPTTIVLGKMLSGAAFTLLLMSITAPFVTIAFLLRGVDPKGVVTMFMAVFILIQGLNCFAIFAACSKNKWSAYQTIIPIMLISFLTYISLGSFSFHLFFFGSSIWFDLWIPLFLSIAFIAIMICAAITLLMPPMSNRAFPMRILLMVLFVVTIAAIVIQAFITNVSYEFYGSFETIVFIFLFVLSMTTVCESDSWSIRIRRGLPKSFFKRAILFPFYDGAACGIIWILMIILTMGILENILLPDNKFFTIEITNDGLRLPLLTGCLFFALNYAITAMLIRSWVLKKLKPAHVKFIILILLFLFIVGSFGIYLVNNLSTDFSTIDQVVIENYSTSVLSMLNPVCDMVDPTDNLSMDYLQIREKRVLGLMIWSAISLVLLAIWYKQRLRNFSANFKEPLSYE